MDKSLQANSALAQSKDEVLDLGSSEVLALRTTDSKAAAEEEEDEEEDDEEDEETEVAVAVSSCSCC